MNATEPSGQREPSARQRAESLKERVYISFTSLAVVLALRSHADETTPGAAAATLSIVVVGSLLGIFVADLLSHLTVHAKLPSGPELHHMIAVSTEALSVLVTPLLLLAAAGLGLWSTLVALQWSVAILVITLFVIGYLAIRRLKLPAHHKAVIVFAEVLLSLLVIGLELLAHNL
ncbi:MULTISPECIES: hypothetical protein [unclassified Arthrobacter]|uniref:hypothetical protein n=1 Tax=unclassified Arthrobacter TaxID=235627 RepID=UPI002E099CC2|nr:MULTISPECIES: hypothetical protein [unclassified Arthrobacter]MEC5190850.1 hypothetical protein [Arthrobacter sp. MP_M4]MEC5202132.1 hypothetical protein [Arthrobacter sp. MP_M7]